MSDITITTDAAAVQGLMSHLMSSLQPVGLMEFFSTRGHNILAKRAEDRFSSEGDDAVGRWKQLTRTTARVRQTSGFPGYHPINVRTGQLKDLVVNTYKLRPMAGGAVMTMPGNAGGTVLSKLRVAQQGSKRGGNALAREVPARPVLALDQIDADLLGHALMDWIQSGLPVP